jgi:hypothetical protein
VAGVLLATAIVALVWVHRSQPAPGVASAASESAPRLPVPAPPNTSLPTPDAASSKLEDAGVHAPVEAGPEAAPKPPRVTTAPTRRPPSTPTETPPPPAPPPTKTAPAHTSSEIVNPWAN